VSLKLCLDLGAMSHFRLLGLYGRSASTTHLWGAMLFGELLMAHEASYLGPMTADILQDVIVESLQFGY
jgi:hypothetical protein